MDVITINPGAVDTQLLTVMESKFARANKNSPFIEPCEFSMKCKNAAMKYSTCSDTQYIVDNAIINIQNRNIILVELGLIIFNHIFLISSMIT